MLRLGRQLTLMRRVSGAAQRSEEKEPEDDRQPNLGLDKTLDNSIWDLLFAP